MELVAFEYVVLDKIIAVVNASGLFAWFWIVINNKNSDIYIYSVKVFTRKYAWRHQPNDSFSWKVAGKRMVKYKHFEKKTIGFPFPRNDLEITTDVLASL